MIKIFCDICGEEITNVNQMDHYKVKRYNRGFFPDTWWDKLTVHKSCWRELSKIIDERRNTTVDTKSAVGIRIED